MLENETVNDINRKSIDKHLEELCSNILIKICNHTKCQEFFNKKFIEYISYGVTSYSEEELVNLVKDLDI